MAFTEKNLVTDFGATGISTDDASPAFVAFQTWALSQSAGVLAAGIRLWCPGDAGQVFNQKSTTANDLLWIRGIPLLEVKGLGGRPKIIGTLFNTFTFPTTNQCSTRIASCKAGDTTLRVLNPVDDSAKLVFGRTITQSNGVVYRAGRWLHLTGLDTIGFGDPSQQYQEYVELSGYDPITGIIPLATPVQFNYSQNWPVFNSGALSGGNATDNGGAATVYVMDQSWDANVTWNTIEFNSAALDTLLYAFARAVQKIDCKASSDTPDGLGMSPTVSQTDIWDNFDQTDRFVEVDKSITNFVVRNGSSVTQLLMQNSSVENLTVDASTVGNLNGTAKNTIVRNGSVIGAVRLGPTAGGIGGTFTADSSVINAISPFGVIDTDIIANGWTISGGVITAPTLPRWAIPGAIITFSGTLASETSFEVYAVWRDGGDSGPIRILTSLNGWPANIPLGSGGTRLDVSSLGATSMYVTNCTGCADIVNLSQAGAQGKRFGEYTKHQYVAADTATNSFSLVAMGKLVALNINVITPYSGAGALTMNPFGQFNNGALAADGSNISDLGLVINCKVAGLRTFTPTAVTGNKSGDTFPTPSAIWIAGSIGSFFSADVSGAGAGPVVEVESITDMGVVGRKVFCQFKAA